MNSRHKSPILSILLLSLAGCSIIPGKDPSTIEWDPVSLSSTGCPDISGSYSDKNNILISQFTVEGFPNRERKYSVTRHKPIPFKKVEAVKKAMPGQRFAENDKTYTYSDRSEFYKNSQTVIRQTKDALTFYLKGEDKQLYEEYEVPLALPQIGCIDGKIAIREISASHGGEGALGSAYATETRIRKLSDGSLEVERKTRNWYYSTRGLLGIGADGYASGTEPRRSKALLIFPMVEGSTPPNRP
ncbi:MAG: hypothetical protein QM777_19675 [Pseudorhodoferax sp.]